MFNKKNKFQRFFVVFFISLLLGSVFLFTSSVFAGDVFGTDLVEGEINLEGTDPRSMAAQIINVALGLLAIIAVVIVIYGGFVWMTSDGNEEKVNRAKGILKAGVIGLVIILASWGIASFVLSQLGGATGVVNVACVDNDVRACGCNGVSTCLNGEWGSCLGSDCNPGGPGSSCYDPNEALSVCSSVTICNSGLICDDCECKYPGEGDSCGDIINNTCSPDNADCSNPNLFCDATSCTCEVSASNNYSELGDPCSDGGTCTANNPTCNPNHGLTCDPNSCECVGSPVITGFSPLGGFCNNNVDSPCSKDSDCGSGNTCNFTTPNASAGNFFTILGYNFNDYSSGSSTVSFISESGTSTIALDPSVVNNNCSNSWTNTSITVALPTTTPFNSGDDLRVEVITKNGDSYNSSDNTQLSLVKWNDISRPGICNINKASAKLNESINYSGINLLNGQAYFGNNINNVLAYAPQVFNSNTSGVAHVPNLSAGKTSTFVQKTYNSIPIFSNFLDFDKEAEAPQGPSISDFTPKEGNKGQYVTMFGIGFNDFKGDSMIKFETEASDYDASFDFPAVCSHSTWSDTQIVFKVPDNIIKGNYKLSLYTKDNEPVTTNDYFNVNTQLTLAPGLCKISPKSGPQNSPVYLWGEYFGSNPSVVFNINKTSATSAVSEEDGADKILTTVSDDAITGPVVVKRDATSSNSLNFSVASCSSNSDCGSEYCCLPGTSFAGACVTNLSACFSDTPDSSFFQWGFTTGFSTTTPPDDPDDIYSCASYNFCPTDNWTCPNMPGLCSPYNATDRFIEVADCKSDCSNFDFCATPNSCSYDSSIDKCVLSGSSVECSLGKKVEYNLGYGTTTKTAICKNYRIPNTANDERQYFEITVDTLCPTIDGVLWSLVPGTNNKCINAEFGVASSTCSLCPAGATCQSENSGDEIGFCASPKVCPGNATCDNNNKCVKPDISSCQCCCEKSENLNPGPGNPACCYPLTCDSSCGVSAVAGATNADFGLCSGCASAGTDTATRDLACNCATVSGQYCEVSAQYEKGVCLDCTSLGVDACTAHPSTCCWDEQANDGAGLCRGGISDDTVWGASSSDIGYCPYYNCDSTDPTLCNSIPDTDGQYPNTGTCDTSCRENCAGIENEEVCKEKDSCCWNSTTNECSGGDKYSENHSDPNYGLCTYFNCVTPNEACSKGTSTTQYLNQSVCDRDCAETSSGFGRSCYVYPNENNVCSFNLCNNLTCLLENGNEGNNTSPPSTCGTCCCDPLSPPDQCSAINSNLTCVADKGMCTGSSRGLCCGCSSDQECSPDGVDPTQVGCGFDSCCKARPKIATDTSKVAELSVSPEHTSNNTCRNALIEINFDQRMDPLTLEGNILLLEERDSGPCPSGTYQISLADEIYQPNKNIFARIKNIFQKSINYIAKITGRTAVAAPSDSKTYCAVFGLVDFEHDTSNDNKTTVYFKPNKLLEPSTTYFVVVKGDEDLDSSSGVRAFSGVGMNGPGYYNGNSWTESNSTSINFGEDELFYENSYIWDFTTLSVNTTGQGICEVNYVKVSPESYLFQTTENDINENDTDPAHPTFNSVRDRDTQYTAQAYSSDSQPITPTDNYDWTWEWEIVKTDKFSFASNPSGWSDSSDRRLVRVNDGVAEGNSDIKAKVIMATSTNITSVGDSTTGTANAHVLICRNPWPEFDGNGLWHPWTDDNQPSGTSSFNYELYYCRDHGSDGIGDDLPGLDPDAIFKGGSSIKVCSNNPFKSCSANTDCPGGLCLSSFLKETYFFRD